MLTSHRLLTFFIYFRRPSGNADLPSPKEVPQAEDLRAVAHLIHCEAEKIRESIDYLADFPQAL